MGDCIGNTAISNWKYFFLNQGKNWEVYYKSWVDSSYWNKNNQKPYMTNKNQRCKMVTLLNLLKNIYVIIFHIHIPESIVLINVFAKLDVKR